MKSIKTTLGSRSKAAASLFLCLVFWQGHPSAIAQVAPQSAAGSPTTTANTQTLKGRVVDASSQFPLPGAAVLVLDHPELRTVTDTEGRFVLAKVPIGRQTIRVVMMGYQPRVIPNILLTAGKQVEQDVALEESLASTKEVVVEGGNAVSGVKAIDPLHEMAFVSARSFNVEETMRYAGSRNDPARMASNFAGVQVNNDGRNDIIIRGNSPIGMLWRMDGLDIPNPSHFGAAGATGGPVTILNNMTLAKSDFLTGAFPAEFGNAYSGVFDLQMRRGNRDKREYMGQIGFNGFEAGAEGPFRKGGRSSYMVNYRYSTLAVLSNLGFRFGTGAAVPNYQDLTFKTSHGVGKNGKLEFFGIGGFSSIRFDGKDYDTTNLYSGDRQNLDYRTRMGVAGASWLHFFSERTYGKLTMGISGNSVRTLADSLSPDLQTATVRYRDKTQTNRSSVRYVLNHKFDARWSLQAGGYLDRIGYSFNDSLLTFRTINGVRQSSLTPLRQEMGHTYLIQSFAQASYRVSDAITATAGLHSQSFALNQQTVLEPRAGVRYQMNPETQLSLGYGYHSMIQPLAAYFYTPNTGAQEGQKTNTNLGFTRSHQTVIGLTRNINPLIRLKLEAYYQALSDVPVERQASSYSLLNFGADFNYPDVANLVNTGKGRSYGVEATLERVFSKGYYFLVTGSISESQYQGSDAVWRNSAFKSPWLLNVLAGKEWKLSDKYTLAFDTKLTTAAGRYFTPYDVQASLAAGSGVRLDQQAYSQQFENYFRLDTKVTVRMNSRGITQEFFIDIQNITNRANPFAKNWSADRGRVVTIPQLGLFPNFNYRIWF